MPDSRGIPPWAALCFLVPSMSLYIRLECSFYRHRKTLRLRAVLKDDAKWIPPALWCWAAENQADGDLSKYTADEIAVLIGYTKDATRMLQALKNVGFIDENMHLHDWDEWNGYHSTWHERAKTAAAARWSKEKEKQKEKIGQREDKRGQEPSIAISNATSIIKQEFDVLWKSYPSKTGSKEKALLSWKKYRAQGDTVEQAAVGIAKYVAHVEQRRKTDFPKLDFQNGLTFFNGRGWKTEWEVKINDPSRRQSGMSMADLNKMIGERVCTDQIQPKECPPTAKKPSDPF